MSEAVAVGGRMLPPVGRLGQPADIANGVQFFAAERSSWVTGQVIAIDGGSAFLCPRRRFPLTPATPATCAS